MANLSAKLQQAIGFHQRGLLAHAQVLYEEILAIQPGHFDALHMLGMIAGQSRNFEAAVQLIDRAIQVDSNNAAAYNNRGIALRALKKPDAALASYDRAIAIKPDNVEAYSNRGNVLRELGRLDAALASHTQAVAINPGYAEGHYNRGIVLGDLERWEMALASYDQAIAVKADYAEAYNNRGTVLQHLRQWPAALASFERAISVKPDFAEAHSNRGNILRTLGRLEEALSSCQRAVAVKADFAGAHSNLGNVLFDSRQGEAALASYERAIALKPDFAEAYVNRGNVLRDLGQPEQAVASFDRALSLESDYAQAYEGRGNAFRDLGQYAAAIESYDRALAIEPNFEFLLGLQRYVRMQICDWSGLERDMAQLASGLAEGEPAAMPFPLLALSDSPSLHRRAAQIWVRERCPPSAALPPIPKRTTRGKLRIGYFSADFRDHPVSVLTAELFETHDRSKFEVLAFSFGPDTQDPVRRRMEKAFDRFIDVRDAADRDIALMARRMELDIAVDLGGFTQESRPPRILAMRAAPLQVAYLGYPGTMGAEYVDYLVGDRTLIPEESRQHCREKIIYLPGSYLAHDSTRAIAGEPTREAQNLPQEAFVFCCFNNSFKLMPGTFDRWMRLLQRVEGSVLWLAQASPAAVANLRREAAARGVDPERLVFARRLPDPAEHLARHRLADLFLDTLPYNAHATAADALWAGLPVLTCAGEAFAGRVAASLLNAIGLPELIAATPEQYEERAVALATDARLLAGIRQKLARNRTTTSLFDSVRFTRHLEAAYARIHERYQADLGPDHVYVDQLPEPA